MVRRGRRCVATAPWRRQRARRRAGRGGVRVLLACWVALALVLVAVPGLVACGGGTQAREGAGVVRVSGGLLAGVEEDGVRAYLGVPYAAPPVGDLRWRPPQPVRPWSGVRVCDTFGPACPQPADGGFLSVGRTAEDCLYLNVWAPAAAGAGRRGLPVMVWIHGGGFSTGAGSLPVYDGARLARHGVVVVTINYRLGPLGFFAHPALRAEAGGGAWANYGLLDQMAALRWVRENIAVFGGDPHNVTVFGESAGGMSICDLMVSPSARGLFARGIVESAPFDARGPGMEAARPLPSAERLARRLSRLLGCAGAADELAALRAAPAWRLLRAADRVAPREPGGIGFGPVVDGRVLPDHPARLFAVGRVHDVDLLVGANADEASLFLAGVRDWDARRVGRLVRRLLGPRADEVLPRFPAREYGGHRGALGAAVTAVAFLAPARFAAASVARAGGRAYLYHFARRPPAAGALGAFHGLEIPYVFGNPVLTLDVRRGVDGRLSAAMMRYWVSFARTGDPNAATGPGPTLPRWPRYDPSRDRCLLLAGRIRAAAAPFADVCDLADRLRAARLGGR